MLSLKNTVFVLVDAQTSLFSAMPDKEALLRNLERLVQGMQTLEVPLILLEQTPDKIGRTLPELRRFLGALEPVQKECFSCCGSEEFMSALKATGRRQVVIAGIETHVCVYQTATDLAHGGYDVEVVADAVSSRSPQNRELALARMRQSGCGLTSVEMVLFELMRTSAHPAFRDVLRIVK
ncbi:MAG: hydrolase [Lentisphaerae bacterium]|nr:hydrolase [Lentisphaerota bacterium]